MAAEAEARRRGADDAVFLARGDIVLEGPVTNVWWRLGDVLYTPALELGILAGVTRATLIEEAAGLGIDVREGAFPLEHLAGADEAFTSSSIREVMPVVELDGRALGDGRPGATAATLQRGAPRPRHRAVAGAPPVRDSSKLSRVRVLSIVHGANARSALFGDVVREQGHDLDELSFAFGEAPAEPERYDAVMVFGGAMNVHEIDGNPWLTEEQRAISRVLDAGVPIFGVCLGLPAARLRRRRLGLSSLRAGDRLVRGRD